MKNEDTKNFREGKGNLANEALEPSINIAPRARIFSTSIGFLAPLLIDAVAHAVHHEDLNSIQYLFDRKDIDFQPFTEEELMEYGFRFPLLSHDYTDESLNVEIRDQMHDNDIIKQYIFEEPQREVIQERLIHGELLNNFSIGNQNPSVQNLNSAEKNVTPNTNDNGNLLFTNNPSTLLNTPPQAFNDSGLTIVDNPYTMDLLKNDFDSDGDTLSIVPGSLSNPSNGKVNLNANGTATYTPNKGFYGTDSFDYQITDGKGGIASAKALVTIIPMEAFDDSGSTSEEKAIDINVIKNDFDYGDGNPISVFKVNDGTYGTTTVNTDGTVKYTPNKDFYGVDTFTYTITDGKGNFDTATVTVNVNPIDDIVDAVNDTTTINEDTAVTVSVLSNDNKFGDPESLTVTATPSLPANGNVLVNGNGTITYTPNKDFFGVDSYTYTITDGKGNFDTATVTINVNPTDDIVDAINDTTTTNEDTAVTVSVLSNDNKFGDPESLTVTATPSLPSNGSVLINGNGTITYTPNKDFFGVDTFTYTITDGKGNFDTATVTVNVTAVDDIVDAINDTTTTNEDTAVTVSVLTNDNKFGDPENLTVTATPSLPSNGSVLINGNGTITYTPNKDFFGTDSFTYTITDGQGNFDTATVTVNVNPIDDIVDAVNDATTTNEDTAVTVSVLSNDNKFGDPENLTVTATPSLPSNGSVLINGNGTITYTPNKDFFGTDSFTYTITDGKGNFDTATVTVNVTAVDDIVDAVNDTATTNEDTAVTVSVLSNDNKFGDPENLTVTATPSLPSNGSVLINGNGTITYTPNKDFFGVDSYTYTITDGKGNFDTATVTVNVTAINDLPKATNDSYTTDEDTVLNGTSVLLNDSDVEGPLTISAFDNSTTQGGTVSMNLDGTFTYNPKLNFYGTDTFTYTAKDSDNATVKATVTITVNPIDDIVDAVNDTATTNEDTAVNVSVLSNDNKFGDPENLTVTATPSLPSNGNVLINGNGTITYTPKANFFGVDTFTYTITDGKGNFDTATVTVNVTSVNDLPTVVTDKYTTAEDTKLTVPVGTGVLVNDSDVEGVLVIPTYNTTSTQGGTISMNTDGSFSYTPKANFFGNDTFTYTAKDTNNATAKATVTITVTPLDDPVDAVNDTTTTNEDTAVTVSVLTNDNKFGDPENLTVTATPSLPSNGSVLINGNGTITYTPNKDFFGVDTFTYTITDGKGNFDTATVTVNVTSVNDLPKATNDSYTTDEDTKLTVPVGTGVLVNDSDVEGVLVISTYNTTSTQGGTISMNTDGSFSYTPKANFFGNDTFTYTAKDTNNATVTATVTITVTPLDDPVDAINDTSLTQKNNAVTISVLGNDNAFSG